ncbi:SGNH/GDSL hydrolase family protein [Butyrivibrio sp. MC2013]|uniref:SGNH/GDSL hydrolase family protein n=1 Tax=Butyrivibrio sp. MC2013 TaxID=1280686 RepID=UPI0004022FCC|nr:SGNH/GDSL hydrolase family protein [Butyrivibrio sp. MC2013]
MSKDNLRELNSRGGRDRGRNGFKMSLPVFLLIIILLFAAAFAMVIYKFQFGGVHLSYDPNYEPDISLSASDIVLLPLASDIEGREDDGREVILCLGNDVYCDDKDSGDGLVQMIGDMTGAEVISAAFPGSCVALNFPGLDLPQTPDGVSFTAVADAIATGDYGLVTETADSLGEDAIEAAAALKGVDMNAVDTISIMYDARDYLSGKLLYNPSDVMEDETGIVRDPDHDFDRYTYMGAFIYGIRRIHAAYPHIRIVMNSFTWVQARDGEGNPMDADVYNMGNGVLNDYYGRVILACESQNVSFIDNLDGFISQDNKDEYMSDDTGLLPKARQYVAYHFTKLIYPDSPGVKSD